MPAIRLPFAFLVAGVLLAASLPGSVSADPGKCRAAIAKEAAKFAQAQLKTLQKCEESVVKGKLPGGTDCEAEAKSAAKLQKARDKMRAGIAKQCGGADKTCGGGDDDTLFSIGWNLGECPDLENAGCDGPITDCGGIGECVACTGDLASEQLTGLYYGDLAPTGDKAVLKCQLTIGKEYAKLVAARVKILQKCWAGVNKGKFAGPCPDPGDGKSVAKLLGAQAKTIAKVCKACGGPDKVCGGGDDLTVAEIGFMPTCPDVTTPPGSPTGGIACGGPVTTLEELRDCATCVSLFKSDCLAALAVPWGASYPGECNPGCGNDLVEAGEVCDGTDAAACPGECAPPGLPDECTCPNGSFSLRAEAGADLDTGWTGIAHDQSALVGHLFDARTYGCSSGGPDTECSFVAEYPTPFFGAPLPLSSGGVPVCVHNEVLGLGTGTLDVATGDFVYDYSLTSRVHTGLLVEQPCPTCDGDLVVDDDVKNGTCNGGPSHGAACDADAVSPSFGNVSFDCLADPGSNIGNLLIVFDDATTGLKSVATSAASPNCSALGVTGEKCFCDTCNNLAATPCMTNADCPVSGGQPGICGGRRCLGGANNGAPCTVNSECTPGFCQVPGNPTAPNGCAPPDGAPDGCQPIGGGEGECADGPTDQNCAPPEAFRGCSSNAECPLTNNCVATLRKCFLDPVERSGSAGLPNGAYAGTFCIPPTGSSAVNNVAGLPGLGALVLPYSVTTNVP